MSQIPSPVRSTITALALSIAAGCSDQDAVSITSDNSVRPGQSAPASAGPAYVIGLRVDGIEDRFIYFGAFDAIPTTEPSRDGMVELVGSWQLATFDGSVFAWEQETGQLTRYSIEPDLSMRRGQTMSLAGLGLEGWRYHAFVSPTRAYTLGLELGVVAVWDPTTMQIVDELRFDPPSDFASMDAYPLSVFVRGEQILAPLFGDNFEAQTIGKRQVVGIIDTATSEVRFIYDGRCLPSGLGHVAPDGTLYLDPYQSGTYHHAYAVEPALAPPCSLRIRPGEDRFDPDFVLDYQAVLGVHAQGVWPIAGDFVMALANAPGEALPVNPEDYWSMTQAAYRVDVVSRIATPYAGMPAELQMQSAGQHVVDGRSFYQNYRYTPDDQIEVVEVGELTPEGWQKQFDIHSGDLWSISRAR